jgi:hypothetical protein
MSKHVLHRVIFGTANISKDPEALVLAAKISIQDAILHDHCRYHVQFADYPGMVPEKGQSVRGTYVAGLTDDNIKFLDWFEGTEYIKAKVKPFLLRPDSEGVLREDAEVDAETYIFVGGEERLDKKEWSFDVFVKEKLQNWADHSTEYAGELRQKPTVPSDTK